MLELSRLGKLSVSQDESFGEIYCERIGGAPSGEAGGAESGED